MGAQSYVVRDKKVVHINTSSINQEDSAQSIETSKALIHKQ